MARDLNFTAGGSTAVVGADEFAIKLRKMNAEVYKQLGRQNRAISKIVVDKARGDASALGRMQAKAAKGVQATNTRNGVGIRLTKGRYAFAFGAEYGAKKYPQFQPWRGNQFDANDWGGGIGYFFFPAIRESRDEVFSRYLDSVRLAAASSGIDADIPRQANAIDMIGNGIL